MGRKESNQTNKIPSMDGIVSHTEGRLLARAAILHILFKTLIVFLKRKTAGKKASNITLHGNFVFMNIPIVSLILFSMLVRKC